jgi:hypothetical protein
MGAAMPKNWTDRAIMFSVIGLVAWAIIGIPLYDWISVASDEPANRHSAQQPANSTHNEDRWLTKDAAGFFTFLLVIIGGFQVGLFLWQLQIISASLDDAKIAAEAAKEGADAAKEGAQATRDSVDVSRFSSAASNRAYIFFNGCRWISHRENDTSPVFWRIRPRWVNGGNTPPRNLNVYVHYTLRDDPLPTDYEFVQTETSQRPALLPPKGEIESQPYDCWGTDLLAVKNGTKHFYIWGTARYRDIFPGTPERVTKFCVYASAVTGDPTSPWHADNNPMEIAFVTYERHNCADEDCHDQA